MGTLASAFKAMFYQKSTSITTQAAYVPALDSQGDPAGAISMANLASVLGGVAVTRVTKTNVPIQHRFNYILVCKVYAVTEAQFVMSLASCWSSSVYDIVTYNYNGNAIFARAIRMLGTNVEYYVRKEGLYIEVYMRDTTGSYASKVGLIKATYNGVFSFPMTPFESLPDGAIAVTTKNI